MQRPITAPRELTKEEKRSRIMDALVRLEVEYRLLQQFTVVQTQALIRAEIKKLKAELIELDGGGKPPS